MKNIFALCFVACLTLAAHSQTYDYKTLRDSLTRLSCKPSDSLTVALANRELLGIDTNLIDLNMNAYYSDLGFSYSRLFHWTKDTIHIMKGLESYEKSNFHKPNSPTVYWQLAYWYSFLKDCEKGMYYLERHIAVSEETYLNQTQISSLRKKCE